MRSITKSLEPNSLTQYRSSGNANFEPTFSDISTGTKQEIRESLVGEQGGICCYCMGRIFPDSDTMKIEHWQCQERFSGRQLDYTNLLGACKGGEIHGRSTSPNTHHCDTRKGNLDFCVNPSANAVNLESRLRYLADGTVEAEQEPLNSQLNDVLNLNYALLKSNRVSALNAFKQTLGTTPHKKEKWKAILTAITTPPFTPYCEVIAFWIRKRLSS